MEASSNAESARAKAEARRQKILARQKDRLSTITGTYAQPDAGWPQDVPVAAQEAPQAVPPQVVAAQAGASGEQQPWQQQQLESLLAAAQARLQQAQAMAQDSAGSAPAAGAISGASADAQTMAHLRSSGGASVRPGGAAEGEAAGASLAPYLQKGAQLGRAASRTRPARLLVAVLLAYALCAGLLDAQRMMLPPVLLVGATELCIALGGLMLEGGKQQSEDELESVLPVRLRQFNLMALFPGAKEALQGLMGLQQFVNGLSEDVSAYIVTCVLLLAFTHHWHIANSITT